MYTKVTGMTTDCMQQTPAEASSLNILVEEYTEHALLLGSQIMLEQKLLHWAEALQEAPTVPESEAKSFLPSSYHSSISCSGFLENFFMGIAHLQYKRLHHLGLRGISLCNLPTKITVAVVPRWPFKVAEAMHDFKTKPEVKNCNSKLQSSSGGQHLEARRATPEGSKGSI